MNKHKLQTILEDKGYICYPYTGRGMILPCLGLKLKNNIGNMFADIITSLKDDEGIDPFEYVDIANAFDSMLTTADFGMIIYFTDVEYCEGDNE